jgi:hypothetical protein
MRQEFDLHGTPIRIHIRTPKNPYHNKYNTNNQKISTHKHSKPSHFDSTSKRKLNSDSDEQDDEQMDDETTFDMNAYEDVTPNHSHSVSPSNDQFAIGRSPNHEHADATFANDVGVTSSPRSSSSSTSTSIRSPTSSKSKSKSNSNSNSNSTSSSTSISTPSPRHDHRSTNSISRASTTTTTTPTNSKQPRQQSQSQFQSRSCSPHGSPSSIDRKVAHTSSSRSTRSSSSPSGRSRSADVSRHSRTWSQTKLFQQTRQAKRSETVAKRKPAKKQQKILNSLKNAKNKKSRRTK